MGARPAIVQPVALSVTLLFSSRIPAVFLVVDPDIINLASLAPSALLDVLLVLLLMSASSARPVSSPTMASVILTALLDQSPVRTLPLVLPAMLPALPVLSTPVSVLAAHHAVDPSLTSSV
jgi:hypothetical protein